MVQKPNTQPIYLIVYKGASSDCVSWNYLQSHYSQIDVGGKAIQSIPKLWRLHVQTQGLLSLETLDMWKNDQLFKPFFHNVGMVSQWAISFVKVLVAYMLD